ncbi:MAG TPA: cyclodeaminase/cyclohydrolase family protein [Gaiellaceae bacterium]
MLEKSLTRFLEEVAARTSAPGGGSVSAVAVGMAAALAAMAARFSDKRLDDAEDVAAQADAIRAEVLPLAQADADAYAAVLAAYRLPKDDPGRDEAVASASEDAAEIPLRIAEQAAAVGAIAARLAEEGNPNLNGDAIAAALLASAAAQACANLVRINLDESAELAAAAEGHAAAAAASAERARAAR